MVKTKSRTVCGVRCLMRCCLAVFALAARVAAAPLHLAPVFSDHMVLQRDVEVPVWGTAEPGSGISVEFSGQRKDAVAGADGKWMVRLDPLPASSTPGKMTVTAHPSGTAVLFADVLVGEVWFCSGQSNMYRPVGGIPGVANSAVAGSDAVLARPENSRLRLFCDDEHPLWNGWKWQAARPETLERFSATAYFFGSRLLDELDVPVGLVHVSRGGTTIQAWTPLSHAIQAPVTLKYMELYEQSKPVVQEYNRAFKEYRESRKRGGKRPDPLPPEIDTSRTFANIGGLHDRLVDPLVPFAVRGVIWYQGESNASREATARHYDQMLQALIEGWRGVWNQPDLPVYFVQLPIWAKESQYWPWCRQGMLRVALQVENTGMAVTLDAGDPDDLHPAKKKPVGERLARLALAKTYGKGGVASGPLPVAADGKDGCVHVRFDTFGSPLRVNGGRWSDLETAGEDGVFHPAEGEVDGSAAVVRCNKVKSPAVVRYGWKGSFVPTLFNQEGLPASPFCFIRDSGGTWRLCRGGDGL